MNRETRRKDFQRFSQNKYNQTNTLTHLRTFYTQTPCQFSCFFRFRSYNIFDSPRYFCSFVKFFLLLYIFVHCIVNFFPLDVEWISSRRIIQHICKKGLPRDTTIIFAIFCQVFLSICLHVYIQALKSDHFSSCRSSEIWLMSNNNKILKLLCSK